MTETCKTLIKLPSTPAYGVPVVRRELRIRFKGENAAQVVVPESLAVSLDLPKGNRCIVELVNVLDAEGSVEQDRLDFVVGEKKWSLGGMAADPIEPPPAPVELPAGNASKPRTGQFPKRNPLTH